MYNYYILYYNIYNVIFLCCRCLTLKSKMKIPYQKSSFMRKRKLTILLVLTP